MFQDDVDISQLYTNLKSVLTAAFYSLACGVIGGFVYNPYDVPAYINGAEAMLQGIPLYDVQSVVYPPLLYAILTPIVATTNSFSLFGGSYLTVAGITAINSAIIFIAYWLGSKIVDPKYARLWLIGTLFNPFLFYVIVLFGQFESVIILGLVGAIYGQKTGRYGVGGATLAFATAVKIYPAALGIIYTFRHRDQLPKVLIGAAGPAALTLGLSIMYFPDVLTVLTAGGGRVRPINILYIFTAGTITPSVSSVIFKFLFLASVLTALNPKYSDHFSLLMPIFIVSFFYTDLLEYRWAPLCVGLILVGSLQESKATKWLRRGGIVTASFGFIGMLAGSLEGIAEGDPWLAFNLFNPTIDVGVPPSYFLSVRVSIAFLLFISTAVVAKKHNEI